MTLSIRRAVIEDDQRGYLTGGDGHDTFIVAVLNSQVNAPVVITINAGQGRNTAVIGLLDVVYNDPYGQVAVNFLDGSRRHLAEFVFGNASHDRRSDDQLILFIFDGRFEHQGSQGR